MSKLDELLQGVDVEWLPLGDVCKIIGRIGYRGYTKKDIVENKDGAIALSPSNIINDKINYEKLTFINWDKYYESPEIMIHNGDIIFCKTASVGKTAYVEDLPYLATLNPQLVVFKEIKCLSKFLSYCLKTENFKISLNKIIGLGSVPSISQKDLSKLKIPIPCPDNPEKSLEIQQEIVRILDQLTDTTNNLKNQLENERQIRKKQFEFYREQLFTFEEGAQIKSLVEIAEIGTGSRNTNEAVADGKYPFFVRSQIPRAINEYEFEETAIITAGDGVGVGKVFHFVNGKYALHQRAYRIVSKDEKVNSKYLFYYIKNNFSKYIEKISVHASVTSLRKPMFEKYPIPIPSLEEQERIVNLLDQFDAAQTAIEEELTKEIKLRTQQYEYYREKLLTFPKN